MPLALGLQPWRTRKQAVLPKQMAFSCWVLKYDILQILQKWGPKKTNYTCTDWGAVSLFNTKMNVKKWEYIEEVIVTGWRRNISQSRHISATPNGLINAWLCDFLRSAELILIVLNLTFYIRLFWLSILIFQKYNLHQAGEKVGRPSVLVALSLQMSGSRDSQVESSVIKHCWWTTPWKFGESEWQKPSVNSLFFVLLIFTCHTSW